jgi:hypothetical protein
MQSQDREKPTSERPTIHSEEHSTLPERFGAAVIWQCIEVIVP